MAAQGLAWLAQQDFAAGAVRSVARHLIPSSGVYSIENGLLDDDGSVYRRGGSEYLSGAAFGAGGLRWVWDGHLAAGPRTVFADASDFGVLAADGVTPVNLGGSGLAAPARAVVVAGMLFIPGGTIYGGSLKAADYAAGTVSVTNGSAVVTGAGTAWLANVDAGMLLRVGGAGRYYVVESVDADGQVTLTDAYEGVTAAGAAYALTRLGSASAPYRVADVYATVAERLVTVEGAEIRFSQGRSELGVLRPHVFDATDLHELPEGARGLGAEAIRDLLVVFSTDGVWTINNMAFDLTDAAGNVQQAMQHTSQDVVLWGPAGVSAYRGALVVPGTDGVYLVDGVSQPLAVSDSVTPLLVEHVRAGRKPGGAVVFKGHYFLPVLDSTNLVVDLLVCRLDRPVKSRGRTFFPWSWFRGHGGQVTALAQRVSATSARQPELLAAGEDGRVLKLTGVFAPEALRKNDADESAHRWLLETRDYPTGNGNVNTVRRARVRYELEDANPHGIGDGANRLTNGGFEAGLLGWAEVGNDGSIVTDWVAAGSRSLYAAVGTGDSYEVSQTVAVAAGEDIGFGFTRKINAGAGAGVGAVVMRAEFLDAGAVVLQTLYAGEGVPVVGSVDVLSRSLVVPAGAVSCRVTLIFNDGTIDRGVSAWVDAAWLALSSDVGGGDAPTIRAFYSVGEPVGGGSRWGSFRWGVGRWSDASLEEFVRLAGPAPADAGRDRHAWLFAAATRYVRVRLESTDPCAKLVLRSMEVAIRPSAKDR